MRLSLIVAVSENGVIGRDNDIPWRLSADLKKFKALTMGHHLIFGRKTYQSIGRALPGRITLVVTRNADFEAPGCTTVGSLAQALAIASAADDSEAFVAGGAGLYGEALPIADRIYLTRVHAHIEGDTRFPEFDRNKWHTFETWQHAADERNEYPFTFLNLERKQSMKAFPSPFTETITFFYTADMDATAKFYEDIFGLLLVVDQGVCRIFQVGSGGYLAFCDRKTAAVPDGVVFTFVTQDVDGWVARLQAYGVELERAAQETKPFGIYNCFLRDPNGYLLEIQRFSDPNWKKA